MAFELEPPELSSNVPEFEVERSRVVQRVVKIGGPAPDGLVEFKVPELLTTIPFVVLSLSILNVPLLLMTAPLVPLIWPGQARESFPHC